MIHLIALICGAILPLSLAPFGLWPLGAVAIAGWFLALERVAGRGFLVGWLFGVGKYAVGVSWVYVSINVYGNAPPPLAAMLVALFVAGLALFSAANAWIYLRLRSVSSPGWNGLLFVCLFVGFEWLLTWFLTGFPWLYPAYGVIDTPLAGFAPVGGVLLVSVMLACSACSLVVGYLSARYGRAVAVALLPWLVGFLLLEVSWTTPGPLRSVALVQGNIDQAVKWLPESRMPIIRTYLELAEPHWGADVMIWPEAAITVMSQDAGSLLDALQSRGAREGTALVLGLPALERTPDGATIFRNTALAIGDGEGRYVKRRLVPFGEYVPFEGALRGLIEFFDMPMSHTASGAWRQPLLRVGSDRAVLAICYEIVYPALVREQVRDADVLITISNDTWFGTSIGPLQHFEMARMRALENGRWLLRDTNNGVTAIVDARGRVTHQLPQFEAGVLVGDYRLVDGDTPYARWGDLPVLLGLLGGLLACGWRRYRTGGARA